MMSLIEVDHFDRSVESKCLRLRAQPRIGR